MNEIKAILEDLPAMELSLSPATVNYDHEGAVRHGDVTERGFPDQHPISAITGLEAALGRFITQDLLDSATKQAVQFVIASGELKGDQGEKGEKGEKGENGKDGKDGSNGKDGKDGKDGTGIHLLGSFLSLEELLALHPSGNSGDAYMVNENLYVWSDTSNMWVDTGKIKGEAGYTPIKGIDYYTDEDKNEFVDLVLSALPVWNGGSY